MALSPLQTVTEKGDEVHEDVGVDRRIKTVATHVDPHPVDPGATGEASRSLLTFQQGDGETSGTRRRGRRRGSTGLGVGLCGRVGDGLGALV